MMRGDAWQELTSVGGLYAAFLRARKGKRYREDVAAFSLYLEERLFSLQRALRRREWRPSPAREFQIYENKPRTITAPAFADRVVHHALIGAIGGDLEAVMHPCAFACRPGLGVHQAVACYEQATRRHAYVMKLDVRQYFASIHLHTLRAQIARVVRHPDILWLVDRILFDDETPVTQALGLPIGSLTSQTFANLYLTDFDWAIASAEGCEAYLRYMDDIFLFGDDKRTLWNLVDASRQILSTHLRLALHEGKVHCRQTRERVDVLGYIVSRRRRWLRNANGYRFRRRLRAMAAAYARQDVDLPELRPRVMAWIGHAAHGETQGLRRSIFREVTFTRAAAHNEPCDPRRVVEQQTRVPALGEPQQE
ncbi:MAG: RNA-directed DNA polymerase [Pseudomonadales bacterium]